ncbi:MAG: tetratricopeptide repeat protein, partial [Deltaproteobacteria bacterium]|nr:tetratricopeptide repeat protein [Deltaproteobacteria bacterium]
MSGTGTGTGEGAVRPGCGPGERHGVRPGAGTVQIRAQARASYEEAYSIYRELGRKEGAARALLDMGRCSRLLGHFMGADELYKKAMELVEGDRGMLRL